MSFDLNAVKKTFFDRKAVQAAVDKGLKQALSKFGAFVRTRAKSSMRKRKNASAPGSPPSVHKGTLKRLTFFSYDAASKSVVIGPVLAGGVSGDTVPHLEEYGGTATRAVAVPRLSTRRASKAQAKAFRRKIKDGSILVPLLEKVVKSVRYPARPYMRPAFAAELPNAPKRFSALIR